MRNFIKAIISISLIVGVAYAANSLPLFNPGDTLTNGKINDLVKEINLLKSSGGTTPSGAVMAFNLAECPIGWSEYTPAQGRFIRGIDKTGASIDPDGQRALESTQEDEAQIKEGQIGVHSPYAYGDKSMLVFGPRKGDIDYRTSAQAGDTYYNGTNRGNYGGAETRPKNIALLYCVKN